MGPGQYPQYTRADFGPEAVGSSVRKHYTSPNVRPYGRVKSRICSFFLPFLPCQLLVLVVPFTYFFTFFRIVFLLKLLQTISVLLPSWKFYTFKTL